MNISRILSMLPYKKPFLFVDKIIDIDENGVKGSYTFSNSEYFYEGHFVGRPITPGVILTECMAQIGVVCLGIYLLNNNSELVQNSEMAIAMSNTSIDFYLPVFPDETVTVLSKKEYFRFNKLKAQVSMFNSDGKTIAKGTISGIIFPSNNK